MLLPQASASAAIDPPKVSKPRPAPPSAPVQIAPLPPAQFDNKLSIGGDDINAKKVETRMSVEVEVNGRGPYHFLVDSGATMTTIDRETAKAAGVEMSPRRDRLVRTGNGVIRVASGRAAELTVGEIARRDVPLEVADNDDLNVLGMNYLSSLSRWGVEGRWLVLVS